MKSEPKELFEDVDIMREEVLENDIPKLGRQEQNCRGSVGLRNGAFHSGDGWTKYVDLLGSEARGLAERASTLDNVRPDIAR